MAEDDGILALTPKGMIMAKFLQMSEDVKAIRKLLEQYLDREGK